MTRYLYGASGGDILAQLSSDGDFEPSAASYNVFTTRTGSTQHTDLQNILGAAITQVTPDADGRVVWFGLDGYQGEYWLQQVATTTLRYRVSPTGVPERLATLEATVAGLGGGGGPIDAIDIVDSSAVGRAVLTAATNSLQQDALGATAKGKELFTAADAAAVRTAAGATSTGSAAITAASADALATAAGGTSTGKAVFTAASQAAGRTALGAGATGDVLFTAATQAAARTALGATATGSGVFTAATADDALNTLGGTTIGKALFAAASAVGARSTIGAAATSDLAGYVQVVNGPIRFFGMSSALPLAGAGQLDEDLYILVGP